MLQWNGGLLVSRVEFRRVRLAPDGRVEFQKPFKKQNCSLENTKYQKISGKYMGKYGNFPEFFRIFSSSSLPPESSEPIQTAMSLFRRAIGPLARRLMPATRGDAYPQEYRTILFPTLPEHTGEVRHVFSRK